MLPANKRPVMIHTDRSYERELAALYARRSAIDDLIESLLAYDRYRATTATPISLRSAAARKSA